MKKNLVVISKAFFLMLACCFNFGVNALPAWTENPNNFKNQNPLSSSLDTIIALGCLEVLNGTYTVGTPEADFLSIDEVLSQMEECGISGPVILDILPGTYTQRVVLDANSILGISETNTVTFRGDPDGNTIIQHSGTSNTTRSVIFVNEVNHLRFENLTINSTGVTHGWGIQIFSNSQNIEIRNCEINITSTHTTAANAAGIVVSGIVTGYTTGAANVKDIVIENNVINGGNYGISVYGLTADRIAGLRIEGNEVLDNRNFGMYIYFTEEPIVHNNLIDLRVDGGLVSATNLDFRNNDGPFIITN